MRTIHTDRANEFIDHMLRAAFPSYTGRKVRIIEAETVTCSGTAWSEGSQHSYVLFAQDGRTCVPVPNWNAPEWGGPKDSDRKVSLNPVGGRSLSQPAFVVEHSYFMGKSMGCRVYAHPSRMVGLLPEQSGDSLTDPERLMLYVTRCLKSFARRDEWAVSQAPGDFDGMRERLAEKGLMRKSGAITNDGRNAVEGWKPPREWRHGC